MTHNPMPAKLAEEQRQELPWADAPEETVELVSKLDLSDELMSMLEEASIPQAIMACLPKMGIQDARDMMTAAIRMAALECSRYDHPDGTVDTEDMRFNLPSNLRDEATIAQIIGRVTRLIEEGVVSKGKHRFCIRKFYCSICGAWGCTIGAPIYVDVIVEVK